MKSCPIFGAKDHSQGCFELTCLTIGEDGFAANLRHYGWFPPSNKNSCLFKAKVSPKRQRISSETLTPRQLEITRSNSQLLLEALSPLLISQKLWSQRANKLFLKDEPLYILKCKKKPTLPFVCNRVYYGMAHSMLPSRNCSGTPLYRTSSFAASNQRSWDTSQSPSLGWEMVDESQTEGILSGISE